MAHDKGTTIFWNGKIFVAMGVDGTAKVKEMLKKRMWRFLSPSRVRVRRDAHLAWVGDGRRRDCNAVKLSDSA